MMTPEELEDWITDGKSDTSVYEIAQAIAVIAEQLRLQTEVASANLKLLTEMYAYQRERDVRTDDRLRYSLSTPPTCTDQPTGK